MGMGPEIQEVAAIRGTRVVAVIRGTQAVAAILVIRGILVTVTTKVVHATTGMGAFPDKTVEVLRLLMERLRTMAMGQTLGRMVKVVRFSVVEIMATDQHLEPDAGVTEGDQV
jgi:hypothetical protein